MPVLTRQPEGVELPRPQSLNDMNYEPNPVQLGEVLQQLRQIVDLSRLGGSDEARQLADCLNATRDMCVAAHAMKRDLVGEEHLLVVDTMRTAAKLSGSLKDQASDPRSVQRYDQLQRLFTELKRFHLAHAAPTLIHEGADREIKRIPSAVRDDFENNRLGRSLVTKKEASVGGSPIALSAPVKAIGFEIKIKSQKTHSIDDDSDVLVTRLRGGEVKATIGIEDANFGAGKVNSTVGASGSVMGGTTKVFGKFENMEKSELFRRANARGVGSFLNPLKYTNRESARKLYRLGREVQNTVSRTPGHDPDAPLGLREQKILKGIASQEAIRGIVREIADQHLMDVVDRAYMPVSEYLRTQTDNPDALAPNLPKNIIGEINPPPSASGPRWAFEAKIAADAGGTVRALTKSLPVAGDANAGEIGLAGSLAGGYRRDRIALERHRTSCELLNPDYTKNLRTSRDLLDSIIAARPEGIANQTIAKLQDRPETFREIKGRIDELRNRYIDFIQLENNRAPRIIQYNDMDAYAEINRLVWKKNYLPAAIRQNPDEFIARSYNEFSIALGKLGVDLAEMKKENHNSPDRVSVNDITEADKAFNATKEILEAKYLKMTDEALYKYSSLAAEVKWWKSSRFVEGKASVPLIASLGDNKAGQIKAGTAWALSDVSDHPDPLRRGTFGEIKISLDVATLGNLVDLLRREKVGEREASIIKEDVLKIASRLSSTEGSTGKAVSLLYRKAPAYDRAVPPEFQLQRAAIVDSVTNGTSIKLGKHIPVTLGLSNTHTVESLEHFEMGKDLGIHVMQYRHLEDNILNPARARDQNSPDYQARFLGREDLLEKYFSNDSIEKIVEMFQNFATGARFAPADRYASTGEFPRFDQEPFTTVSQNLPAAEQFAPGSQNDIHARLSKNLLGDLKDRCREHPFNFPAIRERMFPTLQGRMRALCERRGNAPSVFDTYVEIIDTCKKLSDGAKTASGYTTGLRSTARNIPLRPVAGGAPEAPRPLR
ncbi:hypothetical protein [Brucella sp. IR073]|uniref:hypothetical protein n=1 Tax=unclassified Brucella TaxID=2632610 RepID=UPI003B981556